MTNYILEYFQKIKEDSEIVGEWVTLVYEYIVNGLQEKKFFYDGKKAKRAIKFIESYCHHSKGRNDLIKLELWQKAFISTLFGIVDADGLRQFREVVLVVGRKNGKSLLAASMDASYSSHTCSNCLSASLTPSTSDSSPGRYLDAARIAEVRSISGVER